MEPERERPEPLAQNEPLKSGASTRDRPAASGNDAVAKSSTRRTALLAIAGAAILGASFAFWSGTGAVDPSPSAAQIQAMQNDLLRVQAQGLPLPVITSEQRKEAVKGMTLAPQERDRLAAEIERDNVEFVELQFWDNQAVDGDVIEVESRGYKVTVNLDHSRKLVRVPVGPDRKLFIRGIRDGGGGITMGLAMGNSALNVPPLAPGQVIEFPVVPIR